MAMSDEARKKQSERMKKQHAEARAKKESEKEEQEVVNKEVPAQVTYFSVSKRHNISIPNTEIKTSTQTIAEKSIQFENHLYVTSSIEEREVIEGSDPFRYSEIEIRSQDVDPLNPSMERIPRSKRGMLHMPKQVVGMTASG